MFAEASVSHSVHRGSPSSPLWTETPPLWTDTPLDRDPHVRDIIHPPELTSTGGDCSDRYASYWNLLLLYLLLFQGYCLLYENMLPSVLYARDNWLRKVNIFDVIEIEIVTVNKGDRSWEVFVTECFIVSCIVVGRYPITQHSGYLHRTNHRRGILQRQVGWRNRYCWGYSVWVDLHWA